METAVKERLIGAAVLVLLVVLVVPALLSGPREPPPPDPAGQGPIRSVEIDMGRSRPLSEPEEPPQADRDLVPPAPSGLPEAPAQGLSPSADRTAATPPATEAVALPLPTDGAAPSAAAVQDGAPPDAPPVTGPESAPPGAGWAVQLAALSNQDSARKMVSDLKTRGYAAFILEYRSGGKVLYRVRVGPEAQRERAIALAARLEGEGFKTAVVTHP
jgi:DedD protein